VRVLAPSVRTRLTLWHAGVLALVICIFSAGIFLFVRARLYSTLDDQIRADLATIEKVYQEETGDLGELAHRMGITLFQVAEGETILYQTPDWPPGGTTTYRLGTRGTLPIASPRLGTRRPSARPSGRSASSWRSARPVPLAWRSGVATSSRAGCSHLWAPWRRQHARLRRSH